MTVSLPYAGALDWAAMSGWLGARAIAGVECLTEDARYVRSIRLGANVGTIEVRRDEPNRLLATIRIADTAWMPDISQRIERIFDLRADLAAIHADLGRDPYLAALIAVRPGLRVPGAWDGYELAVRAILGQQIGVDAASNLAGRLVERFGAPLPEELRPPGTAVRSVFPAPEILAECDVAALGMPGARGRAIQNVAREAALDPSLFAPSTNLVATIARLCALPGIGEWTAHYIAMRALREPDAFPISDIGLLRALTNEAGVRPTPKELARRSEPWSPWRAYAAVQLWADDSARVLARKNAAASPL